jgi:transposase-like protein
VLHLSSNRSKHSNPPSLLQFQQQFSNEEACFKYLYQVRWPNDWVCPICQTNKCYYIRERKVYECSDCRHQVSVTAGTIFHKTRTPLHIWFWAIFLVTSDKRGFSSLGLSKILGIPQKRAWLMLQKIRKAMAHREERYQLAGLVELDESFFGATKEGGSRGRGTAKTKVLVGLSLNHLGYPGYLRFKVLPRINRNTLDPVIEKLIIPGAIVKTDGLRSYLSLPQKGYQHERILANQTDILESMRWLHTMVSNAKALIGGTFHGLDAKHLQSYLDEIGYRFNRRHMLDRIFERCVVAMVECPMWTYWDIIGKASKLKKSRLKVA